MWEVECLLRCLDARGRRAAGGRRTQSRADATRGLSAAYRSAVRDCLRRLEEEAMISKRRRAGEGIVVVVGVAPAATADDDDDDDDDDCGGESLRLIHAVIHLAEIFLLPLSSFGSRPTDFGGGYRDAATDGDRRLDGPAGSMTADAVRYLRLHHGRASGGGWRRGGSSTRPALDATWVRAMLEDDQPEYYLPDHGDVPPQAGPFDRPYWNLLLRAVVRGELEDAWTLLSHHSACRRAEEEEAAAVEEGEGGGGMMREISPEAEGFAALRAMLLSAPIPGGRGGGDDYEEEEEEEEGGGVIAAFGDAGDDVDDVTLVDGVPPGADLLWEALPRRAYRLRTLRSSSYSRTILPELYQPRAAMSAFRIWQEAIRNIAFPGGGVGGGGSGSSSGGRGGGVLSVLFKRFPPLRQIVSILVGSAPPSIAEASTLEWSEALLIELLYSRPDIMPDDIAARARVAMSKRGVGVGDRNDTLEEIVVAIMSGNAGLVVETMFTMCGGSSGAALPATMVSKLFLSLS